MSKSHVERILILCKTYPSPSSRYVETSCVAGMLESGELRRLYPVPFRLLSDRQQFRKWHWIEARVAPAPQDRRPESRRLYVDTIQIGDEVPSAHDWQARRQYLSKLPVFDDFEALEQARRSVGGPSLALLRPSRIRKLDIQQTRSSDWTEEERSKLLQQQAQGKLFEQAHQELHLLRKLPYDFHYQYSCLSSRGEQQYRHKLVDWEVGALYWNTRKTRGEAWEPAFRAKLEKDLPARELMFLMGTIHRFPGQWLIVSLIYPPRLQPEALTQGSLFDL